MLQVTKDKLQELKREGKLIPYVFHDVVYYKAGMLIGTLDEDRKIALEIDTELLKCKEEIGKLKQRNNKLEQGYR
jgi:hypothetical protein